MKAVSAALTVLTAFLSLDLLSARQSKSDLMDRDVQSSEKGQNKKNQPHIIFILTDDQGFNDIGYHNPTIKTPTLDKLAAEGVILENYYVQPICTPSRSQLMTGRYQIHTGLQHSIIRPRQPSCLPSHMDTLPERLREAGYATHMVGKWHLGFYRRTCLPTRKGFDTFFGSLTGSVDYYSYGSCDGPTLCGYDLHDNESVAWGHEGKYSTILFTQRARKILERHNPTKRPLFLLLSLQAVHTPLQPPKSYIYPYRDMTNVARRKFAAMVSTVDEAVRNVTYALRKYGYYKNSVIIYSTDNGAQPFTGGSNWPLRGRKGTYWEGGVRGVAFVHSPLLKRRRRVSKALLHITDWFPTLVGLGGGNLSQSQGLDGFDVWPTISEGKESPRQEILHNIDPLFRSSTATMSWDDTTIKSSVQVGTQFFGCVQESVSNTSQPLTEQTGFLNASLVKFTGHVQPGGDLKEDPGHVGGIMFVGWTSDVTSKSKGAAFKIPKKKKVLKQKLNKKSTFKLKTTKKPRMFPHSAAKSKQSKTPPKIKLKPGPEPKPKTKAHSQQHSQLHYRPHSKIHSSGSPSVSSTSHHKSKSKRTTSQNQNLSQSGQTQTKSKKQLKQLQLKSRQTDQYQNTSQTGTFQPKSGFKSSPVWDTSVQAAIRVGDWKLLTGDPGHGDWIPLQMLPSLPGRWWNLERSLLSHNTSLTHKKTVWLFNITGDPYERCDLADQRPDVVKRLLDRLTYYNQTTVPVYFPPDDPRADPSRHGGAWVPWANEDEEEKYRGVYKKGRSGKKKKNQCRLCKLKSFFLKLNTGMMSNRI